MSRYRSARDAEESPRSWYAFEFVFAVVVEVDLGTGEKVGDGTRDEDFACSGE